MQDLETGHREARHRGPTHSAYGEAPLSRKVLDSWERAGYLQLRGALRKSALKRLRSVLETRIGAGGRSPGSRRLLETCREVRRLALQPWLLALVTQALGRRARVVKACLFDKHPSANWTLPWHQDMTVALRGPAEAPGFVRWTVKDGVHHAEAPRHLLEQMLALRLHLDDCPADRGPLLVIPGSHAAGKLSSPLREDWVRRVGETACLARAGDLLLMRPLLLHRSGPAVAPGRRRVLHLEYAAVVLPDGLDWQSQSGAQDETGADG